MYEEYVGKELSLEEAAKLSGKIKLCGIYSITNKVNCKVYVGQSKSIYARAAMHAKRKRSNGHLKNAIIKYGIENFVHKVEVLCTEAELPANENAIFYIYKNTGIVMYNIAECGFGGNTLKYATEERKAEIAARVSATVKATLARRTAEEIADTTAKIKNTWANKTAEEVASTITRLSASRKDYLARRTAEEIANTTAKIKNTWANKTAEEVAEISTMKKDIITAKYTSVVEDIIKLCLHNKLFTFSKYKKYCVANNLEVQASKSYLFRIMYFASHKEQLYEFIAVYKPNMDYTTYCSLCKIKPIPITNYAVAVNYSTYKYFVT